MSRQAWWAAMAACATAVPLIFRGEGTHPPPPAVVPQGPLPVGVEEHGEPPIRLELFRQAALGAKSPLPVDDGDPQGDPRQPLDEGDRALPPTADDHLLSSAGGGISDHE